MNAKLTALSGPSKGSVFTIGENTFSIGRDASNDLSLNDKSVSRRHCILKSKETAFVIEDLDSLNGTFVENLPVKECVLRNGDRIEVGDSLFVFADTGKLHPSSTNQDAESTFRLGRNETLIRIDNDMIGESAVMKELFQMIAKVAPTESTVLICGKTGTGKEMVARAIHANSRRSAFPFVAINCAALTETLLESELFGYEKGAFTGATTRKIGKMEVAQGGTFFLDEVGELSPALQAKLLRVIQEREFERVGGTHPVSLDVRFIAATNKDLQKAVNNSTFREDLFFRLNVISLRVPSLKERQEDIPLLATYFLAKHGSKAQRRLSGISPEARAFLLHYDWPGNVRELENVIERAVVLAVGEVLSAEDLPEFVVEDGFERGLPVTRYHEAVIDAKSRVIRKALEQTNGNLAEAARLLGIQRTYLHRLIRNLKLKP